MKRRVTIRPRAEGDLAAARDWYEERSAGLGAAFLLEMGERMQSLSEDAERSPEYYRGFRRLMGLRFPYKLFYRIEGDRVIVFRVLHAKQDHPRHLQA